MLPFDSPRWRTCSLLVVALLLLAATSQAAEPEPNPSDADPRPPANQEELRFWLANMARHHFTAAEVAAATGLTPERAQEEIAHLGPAAAKIAPQTPGDPLLVLPYPGGRHPRIGFLDGAVRPQRETKISVFTPWDPDSYVVADVPEAIWSNLGLTYLAHTHVPTVWSKQGVELERLEWNRRPDGSLDIERTLPNGIAFGAIVRPAADAVRMELWLTNGTQAELSDLRVQNCVMLKGAKGFTRQTNDNKILEPPYSACRADNADRWIITAWTPCHRAWANEKCPCLHSDPKFPDCPPGETRRLRGWLSFYEGDDARAEFRRIEATGWAQD